MSTLGSQARGSQNSSACLSLRKMKGEQHGNKAFAHTCIASDGKKIETRANRWDEIKAVARHLPAPLPRIGRLVQR